MNSTTHDYLVRMQDFILSLGIQLEYKSLPQTTFLPGLDLGSNCIYVDQEKLSYPGDLLHEAGHLAVTTARQRAAIGTAESEQPWPTDGEEIAAVLWSFAAALHLDIPLHVVLHDDGYKDDSAWLIENFSAGNYIGLPFLQWAGLCYDAKQAEVHQAQAFPAMQRWMRE
jgi:hypothetical protein